MESSYDMGVTPGKGANREDLRGARKRRAPKARQLPDITNTDGNAVPKLVKKGKEKKYGA